MFRDAITLGDLQSSFNFQCDCNADHRSHGPTLPITQGASGRTWAHRQRETGSPGQGCCGSGRGLRGSVTSAPFSPPAPGLGCKFLWSRRLRALRFRGSQTTRHVSLGSRNGRPWLQRPDLRLLPAPFLLNVSIPLLTSQYGFYTIKSRLCSASTGVLGGRAENSGEKIGVWGGPGAQEKEPLHLALLLPFRRRSSDVAGHGHGIQSRCCLAESGLWAQIRIWCPDSNRRTSGWHGLGVSSTQVQDPDPWTLGSSAHRSREASGSHSRQRFKNSSGEIQATGRNIFFF